VLLNIMGVTCGYGASLVLKDASLQINNGDFVGIVGPNGSGKSTLIRTISRVLQPLMGKVLLDEEDVYRVPAAYVAKKMAVVTQEQGLDFPFTAQDVVMMGRLPHIKRFARETVQDLEAVARAMEYTDTIYLADRQVNTLSGGEKQRVLIARALAQEPKILLLDEPTSYLDINYQIEIMELLMRLRREWGLTIIMVLHDLNLASRYCDQLLVVKQGVIHAIGAPRQVINSNTIKEVYGCDVRVEYPDSAEHPYIVFLSDDARLPSNGGKGWVHVVGGGGAGIRLFKKLLRDGWQVTTGVVNVGDGDWHEANRLGLDMVEASPFSQIESSEVKRNKEMMSEADYVILAGIPFGSGNISNLEAVLEAAEKGLPVIVIDNQDISERDFTGGQAADIYGRLITSGVIRVYSDREALQFLEGGSRDAV